MACCGARSDLTLLAQYARSLRTELDDEKLPLLFPMYTVRLDTLVEFQRNMGNAAFVSHQWVAGSHPDPECKQMRVLQGALENIIGNLKGVPVDLISQAQIQF